MPTRSQGRAWTAVLLALAFVAAAQAGEPLPFGQGGAQQRAETIIRIVRSFKGKTGIGDSTATSCNVYVDRGSKEASRAQRAQARVLDGLAIAAAREVLERRSREN